MFVLIFKLFSGEAIKLYCGTCLTQFVLYFSGYLILKFTITVHTMTENISLYACLPDVVLQDVGKQRSSNRGSLQSVKNFLDSKLDDSKSTVTTELVSILL